MVEGQKVELEGCTAAENVAVEWVIGGERGRCEMESRMQVREIKVECEGQADAEKSWERRFVRWSSKTVRGHAVDENEFPNKTKKRKDRTESNLRA